MIVELDSFSKAEQIFLNYMKRVAKDKTTNSVLKLDAKHSADPVMWAKRYKESVPLWSYPKFKPAFLEATSLVLDTKPYKVRTRSTQRASSSLHLGEKVRRSGRRLNKKLRRLCR